MNLSFASLWEKISDLIPEEDALICGDDVLSWREFDVRASKLASALIENGLSKNSKIAIYLNNSNDYLIAQYAIFKIDGCPINVNYRYVEDELTYLLENSDSEAVFFHSTYSNRIDNIKSSLPNIKLWVEVDDSSQKSSAIGVNYQNIIDNYQPMARIERDPNTIYMLYTGGTTGMPKGVMYKQGEFLIFLFKTLKAMGYDVPDEINELDQRIKQNKESNALIRSLVGCPLMHGTGMWLGSFLSLNLGGSVITLPNQGFNPDQMWSEVERCKASNIVIVGDAFAKPMLESLNKAKTANRPYDLDSVKVIISSGVMWSAEVKAGLLEHHDMILMDTIGSTEGGMGGSTSSRENPAETAKFNINPGVIILEDDGEIIEPGSEKIGLIGTAGLVPVGYYKDPEKSAKTFKEVNGIRYSFPGDYARLEQDGTITLLGRGSNCINSAGEKIYPEEVEEAMKKNSEVNDCLVVGLDDERFGQIVTAVVSLDSDINEEELKNKTRVFLAGYKIPKKIIFVRHVERAPNGKANYKWAKEIAIDAS